MWFSDCAGVRTHNPFTRTPRVRPTLTTWLRSTSNAHNLKLRQAEGQVGTLQVQATDQRPAEAWDEERVNPSTPATDPPSRIQGEDDGLQRGRTAACVQVAALVAQVEKKQSGTWLLDLAGARGGGRSGSHLRPAAVVSD